MPRKNKEDWPARFGTFSFDCPECGETRWANKVTAEYCCDTCRARAWKRRNGLLAKGNSKSQDVLGVHTPEPIRPKRTLQPETRQTENVYLVAKEEIPKEESHIPGTIYYAFRNKEGKICSPIYSCDNPYKGDGKVKVWYYGHLIEIDANEIEDHFRDMQKRRKWREKFDEGI